MKRALFSICLLIGAFSTAQAHALRPIAYYVQSKNTACIAKATAIANGVITFTVEETIKGHPPAVLELGGHGEAMRIPLNSEWLLVATGIKEASVGWMFSGDRGWLNAPIQRVDGKIHLVGVCEEVDPALAADPSKGLTLEQLKDLAKTPPPKY